MKKEMDHKLGKLCGVFMRIGLLVLMLFLCLTTAGAPAASAAVTPQIAAGAYHTVALKSDGTLWSWGSNAYGQLGDGSGTSKIVPTKIETDNTWASVFSGAFHTVALKSDGTLWAWGYNYAGQLGDGTTTNRLSPVQIGTDNTWVSVFAGYYHTIALKSDGTLWAWGLNNYGQLGDGSGTNRFVPTQIGYDNTWVSVSAEVWHTIALKSDGTLWAWGDNGCGELGDGSARVKFVPTKIGSENTWVSISAGLYYTIALKSDGTLWAWGYNGGGQLGDGTTTNRLSPVQIESDNKWITISVGEGHTIALKSDGTLWAWGRNFGGQLGDGTTADKHSPVQIGSDNTWESIEAGYSHSLSLKSDGSLWAWGWNKYGQVGDGTTVDKLSPVQIGTDYKGVSITAVTTSPTGRQITVDGSTYTTSETFTWVIGCSHTIGAFSPQSGGPGIQYVFSSWSDEGAQTHSVTTPSAAATYTAAFTIQYQLTTAVSPAGMGSISPDCSGGCWSASGNPAVFTIIPNTGYSAAIGGSCGGTLVGNTYTTNAITGPCTINANFTLNQFTISTSAGTGGSISPSSIAKVNIGGSQAYTITPSTGYFIADVLVDNVSIGAVTSYAFVNVQTSHTISAMFTFADLTPDPFVFTEQLDVSLSTLVTSNTITVTGINTATTVMISGGEYSVNGGAFTAAPGLVNNGDLVKVRQSSSNTFLTKTDTILTINGVNATFSITTKANTPPTANAGMNQTVHAGALVSLDGSGSSDPDGNVPLTYAWSIVSKPASTTTLSDTSAVNPSFIADLPGDYVLSLVVTDSLGATSAPAFITISTKNTAPVADAGPDQPVVHIGTTIHLDGTQSYDLDGDPIAYSWTFGSVPAGSTAALVSANTATPSFTPDVHGDYIVKLVVNDNWSHSVAATVTVSFANVRPVANAGTSQSADVGETVLLNGSGSFDANGDPLSYSWGFTSKPLDSLAEISSPLAANAAFVPDRMGTYVIQLIVNDGVENSAPSTIQVQVVDQRTAAINAVKEVQKAVQALNPKTAFKNASMQKTLVNKLNSVIKDLQGHDCRDALEQLQHDILSKLDGCAKTGAPHKKDWIKTCEDQAKVYPLVVEAIIHAEAYCPLEERPSHDHDDDEDD